MAKRKQPILLVGVPRSGTTWTGEILSMAHDVHFLHEPDNERHNLVASWYKRNVPSIPFIPKDAENESYEALWNKIFSNNTLKNYYSLPIKAGRVFLRNQLDEVERRIVEKSKNTHLPHEAELRIGLVEKTLVKAMSHKLSKNERLLVKSVHAGLALNWLRVKYKPKTLLLFRHPASVIASCLKLGLPDGNRLVFNQEALVERYLEPFMPEIEKLEDPLSLMGLQVSIHYYIWERLLEQNTDWESYTHETLCLDPSGGFKEIFNTLSLEWSEEVERRIQDLDRNGGATDIRRKASELPDKWKKELTRREIELVKRGYSILPVNHYAGLSDN